MSSTAAIPQEAQHITSLPASLLSSELVIIYCVTAMLTFFDISLASVQCLPEGVTFNFQITNLSLPMKLNDGYIYVALQKALVVASMPWFLVGSC